MKNHIMLVAGEASGDILGAGLMRAVRGYRFSGVGGTEMLAAGLEPIVPLARVSSMGFIDAMFKIPNFLWHIRKIANAIVTAQPDALIIIDSYDFSHRVARSVARRAPDIPIINYVPPKVWAWRKGRAKKMKHYIDRCLVIFPFEKLALDALAGIDSVYVGHPALEHIASAEEAARFRQNYGDKKIILVGLGSRQVEVNYLADIFGDAVKEIAAHHPEAVFIIPVAPPVSAEVRDLVRKKTAHWPVKPILLEDPTQKHAALRAADVALVAAGTLTLELGLAGTPFVCAYRLHRVEEWIVKMLINFDVVSPVNLVLERKVFPEFLGIANVKAPILAEAVIELLAADDKEADFKLLREKLKTENPPSEMAAQAVLEIIAR